MAKRKINKLLIGLTGGIASGKTTVARVFDILKVPIYHSDIRAKSIIHFNEAVKTAIIEEFGNESYDEQGNYNVSYISNIVFNDQKKLLALNNIVHPAVFKDQEIWFNNQTTRYSIIESALLFETNKAAQFDKIIVVAADDDIRIDRLVKRDLISIAEAKSRIESQIPQSKKIEDSDYVIWNNEKDSIIKQVISLSEYLND